MPLTPISTLSTQVQNRLEEVSGNEGFWSAQYEIYTALIESLNDLMLLVGRPTQTVNVAYTLTPNTVWQPMPAGIFLIVDVWGAGGQIRKVDLNSMDYVMASWGPDWQNDTYLYGPSRWFPVGLTQFAVHPAPTTAQVVTLDAIAYPTTDPWPYTGTEGVPFEDQYWVALEEYAAHYCRLKEGSAEFQESLALYNNYLQLAARMSAIQDKRDPQIFSPVLGGIAGLNGIVRR